MSCIFWVVVGPESIQSPVMIGFEFSGSHVFLFLLAIHKSGLAYDGGVVIDYECRTLDPYVFAAGPCTRYHKRYYADARSHKYYDSTEIGEKVSCIFHTFSFLSILYKI